MEFCTHLADRFILRVTGPDRQNFLQGLVSNDMTKVTETQSVYAALLTPQGKFLHDLFIIAEGDSYLLDCERPDDLIRRLNAYKLRAKVAIEKEDLDVWAVWHSEYLAPMHDEDPRAPGLGMRMILPRDTQPGAEMASLEDYDLHRLQLGVTSTADMEIEKSTLAEGNFDLLNAIDWKKGCYVGQELTARMHYRGLAKRRLFPVRIEGEAPPHGTLLDGEWGEMRTSQGEYGLALLKIEVASAETPIESGKCVLYPFVPLWMSEKA